MESGRLAGRSAIVTGAGGGICGAIARRFAAEGAKVLCADIDLDLAAATASEITAAGGHALAAACDVADPVSASQAVETACEAFEALNILVSGAAAREPGGNVVELPLEDWRHAIDVNLTGMFLMAKYAIPKMVAAGGGSIVNIASQLGSVAVPNRPAYVTTKAAVIHLTRSMAIDFARDNIRVNSLSPGAIETSRLLLRHQTMEQARATLAPHHPIGRLGRPEEIADAALYLAGDESTFMTGADMVVDGGYTAV